ncbi:MAG TPA: hypothetical protein VJK03_00560 [Candidatus Nanoarchaeia archaeon]|nr:hypothetical protein [Candidatus Nanoarchaeia archaeon]
MSDISQFVRSKEMKGGDYKMECGNYGCYDGCSISAEPRRFFTNEEKVDMLKEYKKSLEKEAQGVAERIATLEK